MKKGRTKKVDKHKKLSKLEFLLGLLVVVTGGAIMIDLLGLSVKIKDYTSSVNELILFPMAMMLLIVGIGVIAKSAKTLEK